MKYGWAVFSIALIATPVSAHICWIEQVVTDTAGVRVFYIRDGLGGGYGPYESAPIEREKPLTVSRSPHGTCTLAIVEKAGRIGVLATATERMPGARKADTAEEWIEAVPPSIPHVYPKDGPGELGG